MGGQKFQYDESGGTFFYFLLSFLALLLIPSTYYWWPRKQVEGKVTIHRVCVIILLYLRLRRINFFTYIIKRISI